MAKAKNPVPDGFHTVTPHLVVKGAAEALAFYARAFGAEEIYRLPGPGGTIMHAEVRIGSSVLMIADENPAFGTRGPAALGGSAVTLSLYVPDADAFFSKATAAGATVAMPLTDMFWGDRYGQLADPFGHQWAVATHVEDLTPQEIGARAAAMAG